MAQLANFDYQLQYWPGREHTNADVLSRLPGEGSAGQVPAPEAGSDEGLMVGVVEAPGQVPEEPPPLLGVGPTAMEAVAGQRRRCSVGSNVARTEGLA